MELPSFMVKASKLSFGTLTIYNTNFYKKTLVVEIIIILNKQQLFAHQLLRYYKLIGY